MKTHSKIGSQYNILIVDDDLLFGDALRETLIHKNLQPTVRHSVAEARKICAETAFDVVLLDNHLPDGSGLELVPDILNLNDRAKIICVTAFPSFSSAVKAIKNGAYDYISKPIDLDELHLTIERALRASSLEAVEQTAFYRNDQERKEAVLIGFEKSFHEIQEIIRRSSMSDATILITGETGTGKNVVAKAIHYQGENRAKPFISLNCAAIPESLIESELFGVEKGAFTGAAATRKGVFEIAEGGTLFLDEIGEMPILLQAKLLNVLEDRQLRRVGGEKFRPVNVRIIAATNALTEKNIDEKRLRKDLFYRLSVIRLHLPPLRERPEDIPALCRYFIEKFAPNRQAEVSQEEIAQLQKYSFPGNVRELRNIIERCLLLQEGKTCRPSEIVDIAPDAAYETNDKNDQEFLRKNLAENLSLAEIERQYILAVYARYRKNLAQTSNALDISLSTLKRKLREFGLR